MKHCIRKENICNIFEHYIYSIFETLYSVQHIAKLILLRRVHSRVILSLWMTQVSSCGTMCDHKGSTLLPDGSFEISRKRVPRGLSCAYTSRVSLLSTLIFKLHSTVGLGLQWAKSSRSKIFSRIRWNTFSSLIFNFTLYR